MKIKNKWLYLVLAFMILLTWIPFLWLYYFLHPWKEMANYLTLLAALAAFTGTIISIMISQYRNQIQLDKQEEHLDKQLKDSESKFILEMKKSDERLDKQLKHENKEKAIFTFKTKIDDILLYISKRRGLTISTTDELYDSLDNQWNSKLFFDINTKSRLFYYFVELKNKPLIFNYLKKEIRDNINSYITNYEDIRFYTQHLISEKGDSDSLFEQFKSSKKRFKPQEIEHDFENKINNEKRYGLSIFKHEKEYIEKSRMSIEWNFLVKGYPSDEIVGNSCELDIYLNLEDEIITEFNKILKNIFKNCESEYNKFGND
jgi:hypothetical protein